MRKTTIIIISAIIILCSVLPVSAYEIYKHETRGYVTNYEEPCTVCGSYDKIFWEQSTTVQSADDCNVHSNCIVVTRYKVENVYCIGRVGDNLCGRGLGQCQAIS